MLLLLLSTLGLASPDAASLTDAAMAVLSVRDDPGCAALFALGEPAQLRVALTELVEVELPPWAPMRAASCLTELAASDPQAWTVVEGLLQRPDQPGFVLPVIGRLDGLPSERAERAAQLAIQRSATQASLQRIVPARLQDSAHAQVRAIGRAGLSSAEPITPQ